MGCYIGYILKDFMKMVYFQIGFICQFFDGNFLVKIGYDVVLNGIEIEIVMIGLVV